MRGLKGHAYVYCELVTRQAVHRDKRDTEVLPIVWYGKSGCTRWHCWDMCLPREGHARSLGSKVGLTQALPSSRTLTRSWHTLYSIRLHEVLDFSTVMSDSPCLVNLKARLVIHVCMTCHVMLVLTAASLT